MARLCQLDSFLLGLVPSLLSTPLSISCHLSTLLGMARTYLFRLLLTASCTYGTLHQLLLGMLEFQWW
ncbi:unnamed protein product [Linum tenue]|uniref:Uncharacterized protein n=1 Tax=Linum tenue TaxID=586396 RepID=A0AAV0PBK2_9ROSI|nr:unnamed protein product [Linum tenue]